MRETDTNLIDLANPRMKRRLLWIAIIVIVLVVLVSSGLAWLAYQRSRDAVRGLVGETNLSLTLNLLHQLTYHRFDVIEGGEESEREARILTELETHWSMLFRAHAASSLCAVRGDGLLLFCNDLPESEHGSANVALSRIRGLDGIEECTLRDIIDGKRSFIGQYRGADRSTNVAAYVWSDELDMLVGIHTPTDALSEDVFRTVRPWWIAFALIVGGLLPLSIGILYHGYAQSQRSIHRAVSAVRDSEERFRRLAEVTAAGIGHVTFDGGIIYLNPTLLRWIEVENLEALRGRRFHEFFTAETLKVMETELQRRRQGLPGVYPVEIVGARGARRRALMSSIALRGPDGSPTSSIGTLIDITELDRAEQALREKEQTLRLALEYGEMATFDRDLVNRRTTWIGKHAEIFGFDPVRFDGDSKAYAELIHPDDLAMTRMRVRRAMETGEPYRDEYRVMPPDGSIRWLASEGRVIFDENGRALRLLGVVRDQTAARIAAEAVAEAKGLLDRVFASLDEAVLVISADGERVHTCNTAVKRIFDVDPEALGEDSPRRMFPNEEAWATFRAAAERGLARGDHYRAEMNLQRADGSEVPCEITLLRLSADERSEPRRLLVIRDISERRAVEGVIRAGEEHYRRALHFAPDAILVHHFGEIAFANPVAVRLFGARDVEELLGRNLLDLLEPEHHAAMLERYEVIRNGGVATALELHIRQLNGESVVIEVIDAPIVFNFNDRPAVQTVFRNLLDRRRAELLIRESETRLRLATNQLPAIMWVTDRELRCTSSVGRGLRDAGLEPEQVVGRLLAEVFSDGDEDVCRTVLDAHARALQGHSASFETAFGNRSFEAFAEPLVRENGTIMGVVGLAIDVTERKRAEQRQQLMMDELDHRVKNTLAAVVSIADQTLHVSKSLADFRRAFSGRIVAMARTHEALARDRWEGVDLREVAELILCSFISDSARRLEIVGPSIRLPAEAALPVSLTLHELATNAVKYGAFSNETGALTITWEVSDEHVRLRWIEQGGPAPEPQEPPDTTPRPGMGINLIEGLIEYELGGDVRILFAPEGLRAEIDIPLRPPSSRKSASAQPD